MNIEIDWADVWDYENIYYDKSSALQHLSAADKKLIEERVDDQIHELLGRLKESIGARMLGIE